MHFVVVEFAAPQGVLRELTRRFPGSSFDLFLLPRPDLRGVLRTVCELHGATPELRTQALQAFRSMDPAMALMQAPEGVLRLNIGLPVAAMPLDSQMVATFAIDRGMPTVWVTVEGGATYVRLLVPEAAATTLADDLRRRLHAAGLEAQVDSHVVDDDAVKQRMQALVSALEGLRSSPRPTRSGAPA